MFDVPVLFLIFNRPDTTRIVFNRICEIRPARLYVAADAPRQNKPGEAEKCAETRAILQDIDWPCEVRTLFREVNLGCRLAVSGAITWFFEQEEQGIILEDDCLPDLSFFPYCRELLEKYKDDERIGHIGGNCFVPGCMNPEYSYDFCRITHIWGWATWRRVWKNVDVDFSFWNKYPDRRRDLFSNTWEEIYFTSFIQDALDKKNGLDPWGVFYYYSLRLQNQLSIYPAVNLVTNIGLDTPDATHTRAGTSKWVVPTQSINTPLVHPEYILPNKKLNTKAIRNHFFSYKRLVRYLFKF